MSIDLPVESCGEDSDVGNAGLVDTSPQTKKARFGSKGWHQGMVLTLCAVLIVGVVAGLGGFERIPFDRIDVDPGTVVSLSLADICILDVTASKIDVGSGRWKFAVRADVRNTSWRPLRTGDFRYAIVIGYTNGEGATIQKSGVSMTLLDGEDFNKTLPRKMIPPMEDLVPVEFYVYIDDDFSTDKPVLVGLIPVVYVNRSVLGLSKEKRWYEDLSTNRLWVVKPPVQINQ